MRNMHVQFEGAGGCEQRPHVHQSPSPDAYRGPIRGGRGDAGVGAAYAALLRDAIQEKVTAKVRVHYYPKYDSLNRHSCSVGVKAEERLLSVGVCTTIVCAQLDMVYVCTRIYMHRGHSLLAYTLHVHSFVVLLLCHLLLQGRRLAAFFAESIPGCAGQIVPPPGVHMFVTSVYVYACILCSSVWVRVCVCVFVCEGARMCVCA
jgi:hypothetical protein